MNQQMPQWWITVKDGVPVIGGLIPKQDFDACMNVMQAIIEFNELNKPPKEKA